ncbi:MAG TPA: 5'-3' exonuclease H3TH domain-containing protein, partial [Chondromyces sp.]|nr:5'-3' exonuclease H3TH domain-containing protein [Chondromyces sp.]
MKKKLILIDGNSIAYRAFFALPLLNNDKGVHTNAVYGFTTMLLKILEEEKPTHILVAFDAGKTTFRHQTFDEYKGGRQKTPPELSEQFPYIRELLKTYRIPQYELENYEADDIIGTLSLLAENDDYEVKIFSGDKDLTQLSSDTTTVCITKKGITDIEEYTPEHINEKYGLAPEQIIDMKGLMGDSSDNIPGVPGVGEKTAIKLLKQFESVDNLFSSLDEVSGKKLKEKLEENKDLAFMSKKLATIFREVPMDITPDQLEYKGPDEQKVYGLFKELGFNSLLNKLAIEQDQSNDQPGTIDYIIVNELKEEILTDDCAFYLEMITDNYHTGEIAGLGISNASGNYFVPMEVAMASALFKTWAENEKSTKVVYDAKRTIIALRRNGIELKGITFDLFIASYLINPSESPEDFSAVAKFHGYHQVRTDEAVYNKGAKRKLPEQEVLAEHIASKAQALKELEAICLEELEKNNQLHLFKELELPLALILADMESEGVRVDVDRLKDMGEELKKQLEQIEETIYEMAGESFNINSP